jgi:predicted regulator of Ras-like GTPase activity (Roadblock/LC7/MglB family)
MPHPSSSHAATILGLATFDLNGLPKEYYITEQQGDIGWMQAIFQGLGLQTLLAAKLKLDQFEQLVIHTDHYQAVLVRQPSQFLAVLIPHSEAQGNAVSEDWLNWLRTLDSSTFQQEGRFSVV